MVDLYVAHGLQIEENDGNSALVIIIILKTQPVEGTDSLSA